VATVVDAASTRIPVSEMAARWSADVAPISAASSAPPDALSSSAWSLSPNPADRAAVRIVLDSSIVSVLLKDVRKRLSEEELTLKLTDQATDFLVKHGYDEQYGARPLKRAIQKFIEDPLSEKILMGEFSKGDEIEVDVSTDGERLDFRVLTSTPQT